jgi:hypothetical protein
VFAPEGPQRDDLAPDFAAALEAEPEAGEFFDSLAQFYRKAYLRWIYATKRSPETRAARISERPGRSNRDDRWSGLINRTETCGRGDTVDHRP